MAQASAISPTRGLAKFCSELTFDEIPGDALRRIKLHILDTLGVGLFGSTLPWSRKLVSALSEHGGKGESTVWGTSSKLPCALAALANGTMCHGFELDDVHRTALLHPGPVAVTSALSFAEHQRGVSGKEFIAGVTAGYEACCRVGMAMGTAHFLRGFHPVGTAGVFGSAASAGRIARLNQQEMANCFGIAASHASGLMAAQYKGDVKRLHAGRAAEAGVMAVLLTQQGFSGIEDVLEAEFGGFFSTMSEKHDPSHVLEGLGRDFQIMSVGCKRYPCNASIHTILDMVSSLMVSHREITPESVERVTIRCGRATYTHVGWPYKPAEVITAQMNIAYCVSTMIVYGSTFVDQFTEEKITDAKILATAQRVSVIHYPSYDELGEKYRHKAFVEILLKDGRRYSDSADFAIGSPERPLDQDGYLEKYRKLTYRVLGKARAEELATACLELENSDDVTGNLPSFLSGSP